MPVALVRSRERLQNFLGEKKNAKAEKIREKLFRKKRMNDKLSTEKFPDHSQLIGLFGHQTWTPNFGHRTLDVWNAPK